MISPVLMRRILQSSVDLIPWHLRNSIRRVPIIRSIQRALVQRYLAGHTFVHTITAGPARGVKFPLTLPEDKLIWTGTWELDLAVAIREAVRRGDVCYDVGSYRGFFAGVMGAAGASVVYCFEPDPANVAVLEQLRSLNPGLPIEIQPLALADRDGQAELILMDEATMGKLSTSSFQPGAVNRGSLQVRTNRLDSLIDSETVVPPQVMKIDVEGAELDVLRGGAATIGRFRPRLFVEAHSPELARDCASFLEALGYSVSVLETAGDIASAPAMEICHLVAVSR